MKTFDMKKGVALVTVMLIILTLTVIAIFTLQMTKTETQAASAFRFNRQATYAAHSVSNHMLTQLNQFGNENASDVLFQQLKTDGARLYYTDDIKDNTGLTNNVSDTGNYLKGDLNRSITQLGSFEDLTMVLGDTTGMSDATMFCRYTISMNAVAIGGRAAQPKAGNTYFTLNDLNARVSSRKYEMAYVLYQPAPCQ